MSVYDEQLPLIVFEYLDSYEISFDSNGAPDMKKQRWSVEEHHEFLKMYDVNGKVDSKALMQKISKSTAQIYAHSQKFSLKLQRMFSRGADVTNAQQVRRVSGDIIKELKASHQINVEESGGFLRQVNGVITGCCGYERIATCFVVRHLQKRNNKDFK